MKNRFYTEKEAIKKDKSIAFGLWEDQGDKVLDENWQFGNNGKRNGNFTISREHIRLIEEEGYQLFTFLQKAKKGSSPTQIQSFSPVLVPKTLEKKGNAWYALPIGKVNKRNASVASKKGLKGKTQKANATKQAKTKRRPSESKSIEKQIRRNSPSPIEVKQEHNKLQTKVKECLSRKHGKDKVAMEENFIDVKVEEETRITLYEVKLGKPISCIKEGLGQVLSYIYRSYKDDKRKKKIVIVGPQAPDEQEKEFIDFIKTSLKIDFEYKHCAA